MTGVARRPAACPDPEYSGPDLDRALDHPKQVGVCTPRSRSRESLLSLKAVRRYPIRKMTRPVPVAGGVAGAALPMSAGSSFHGRRKPNGSAFHRRIMAGVIAPDGSDDARFSGRVTAGHRGDSAIRPSESRLRLDTPRGLPINSSFGSSQGRFSISRASCSGCRLIELNA